MENKKKILLGSAIVVSLIAIIISIAAIAQKVDGSFGLFSKTYWSGIDNLKKTSEAGVTAAAGNAQLAKVSQLSVDMYQGWISSKNFALGFGFTGLFLGGIALISTVRVFFLIGSERANFIVLAISLVSLIIAIVAIVFANKLSVDNMLKDAKDLKLALTKITGNLVP